MSCLDNCFVSYLPACIGGSADPRFRYVFVKEQMADGTFRRKKLHPEEDAMMLFVEDTVTGKYYDYVHANDPCMIRIKCVTIGMFSSAYMLAVMALRLKQTAIHVGHAAQRAFDLFSQNYQDHGLGTALGALFPGLAWDIYENAGPSFYKFIASPWYQLKIEIGAAIGLICPLYGRVIIADAQIDWFGGNVSAHDDARNVAVREEREGKRPNHHVTWQDVTNNVTFVAVCLMSVARNDETVDVQVDDTTEQKPKYVLDHFIVA